MKSFAFIIISTLITSSLALAALAPQQVSKNGVVTVPAGMHLIRDRAGLRWLLPIGMETPPEKAVAIQYFTTNKKPEVIGHIGNQEILNGPINAIDTVVSTHDKDARNIMSRLNPKFAYLMRLEKAANRHAKESTDLQSLGVFGPAEMTTFKLPYIPMPESAMEFAMISDYAAPATKDLLRFQKDGQTYYRFFIHPNYVGSYADLIAKYGIVYHYEALSSSSPRSLVVMDPDVNDPDHVFWTKVSLHKKIDGSVRINTDKKARRAIIMSEAIRAVPANAMKDYHVQFMLEPAAFQPKGKLAATIQREVPMELAHPADGKLWIPAFILQNTGADAVPGLNVKDMAHLAQMPVVDFVRERIVRPLLFSYLSMGLGEGLPGELHTQNFYYEMQAQDGGYLPTGRLMFKDNDGFRYDTELALRKNRSMNFFARFDEPFTWGKFSNAVGLGAEGLPFLGSWYYKLIRNVNGFETLAAYMLRVVNDLEPGSLTKEQVQAMFDQVAADESFKITGIRLAPEDFGYAADKGLNKVLTEFRAKLSGEADTRQRQDESLQSLLASEWTRLTASKRTSALRRALPKDAYYLLHREIDGAFVIEARTPRVTLKNVDPTVGFAMVDSKDAADGRLINRRLQVALNRFTATQQSASHPTSRICRESILPAAGF